MKKDDQTPETQPAGVPPPPRPPKNVAIGTSPGDDDFNRPKPNPKKSTVRINLPPKLVAVMTVKLPPLPPGSA